MTDFYIRRTLEISKDSENSNVIGIIDCSNSISSHFDMLCEAWNKLVKSLKNEDVTTDLFSSFGRLKLGNLIERSDISGKTNILSGFELAFQEMKN